MSVLVLRHEPFEHLGYFAEGLAAHNIPFFYKDLNNSAPVQQAYDALIVMGGPQSANDESAGLAHEMQLIEKAASQNKPVLGICLGSQLIAKALGGQVYKNAEKEIGWFDVEFTPEGKQDPLFAVMTSPTAFFHWHGETFDLPPGATWLAYSKRCRHQAFRVGSNIYGIQFHPEITPEMIVDWCAQPANCGDVKTFSKPIDPHAFDTAALSKRVIDGWLRAAGLQD